MIVELHEQELQSFTEPSIQEGTYYAVEYQRTYYFSQAPGCPDGSFNNFKFYTQPLQVEQKCSTGRDVMIMTGFTAHVFYGPVVIVGVGSFTFPQLSEVKQVY